MAKLNWGPFTNVINPLFIRNVMDKQGIQGSICNYSSVKKEVVIAVLKAFKLLEEMSGSQKNLIDILAIGRDLYCKGAHVCTP